MYFYHRDSSKFMVWNRKILLFPILPVELKMFNNASA